VPNFTAGTSFTDGVTNDVTAAKLNALVADAVPTSSLALASTTGTISNFTASTANITLGTIPTLTAGTTTGTAGVFTSGTITTGVIPTLTTGTTTSTNEVVTNGTITNLSATTSTFLGAITGSTNVINIGGGQIYKDSSGNVGIGTNSPVSALDVNGKISVGDGTDSVIRKRTASTPLYFKSAAGTAEMIIDSSGNVRIGTTSYLGGGAQALSVKQNADAWCMAAQVTTNGNYGLVAVNASNTIVGGMIINASSTSFPTSSDYRLKTNLEAIANGIERIKQLPVYSFNWKIDESGNKVDGFIAHEARSVVPESVVGEKDAVDADGNPIYQGIDQSKIVPLLTAALKEAIAKIETLEAKVTALEAA
jgi:hypothetical protein